MKCFLDATLPGTVIHNGVVKDLPPIIVWKNDQVLMKLHSKDFSFVGEKPIAHFYHLTAEVNMKPNLMQNAAVSFIAVFDDRPEKIEKLALSAGELFDVQIQNGLSILTIRHFKKELIDKLTQGKDILLTQQTKNTVQMLLK